MAAIGLAVTLLAVGYFLWIRSQSTSSLARINHPLPPLVVASSGDAVDLRVIAAGARRVIVFYSPFCQACKEVLPCLQPFPPDLRLILVNETSDPEEPEIAGLPATARLHDRWHALSHAFTVAVLPTVLFVDASGILRDGLIGRHKRVVVQEKLREFSLDMDSNASQMP